MTLAQKWASTPRRYRPIDGGPPVQGIPMASGERFQAGDLRGYLDSYALIQSARPESGI